MSKRKLVQQVKDLEGHSSNNESLHFASELYMQQRSTRLSGKTGILYGLLVTSALMFFFGTSIDAMYEKQRMDKQFSHIPFSADAAQENISSITLDDDKAYAAERAAERKKIASRRKVSDKLSPMMDIVERQLYPPPSIKRKWVFDLLQKNLRRILFWIRNLGGFTYLMWP